jgi:hypothetical protein
MLYPKLMVDPHAHAQLAVVEAELTGGRSLADPGLINNAVLAALIERCPPDYLADRVWRLCEAKRRMKDGTEEDDVRANEAGLKLALAYSIGKPIERAQIVTQTISSDPVADIEARLAKSPALRRSLAAALAASENIPVEQC